MGDQRVGEDHGENVQQRKLTKVELEQAFRVPGHFIKEQQYVEENLGKQIVGIKIDTPRKETLLETLRKKA